MAREREYYKGEGGGFPSPDHGEFYEFVFVVHPCIKSAPTMH